MGKLIVLATMLVGCGQVCDNITNGMCIFYNGLNIDRAVIQQGADLAQSVWSERFRAIDLDELANTYNLVVKYENDEDFAFVDINGYFKWDVEKSVPPEIHILYSSDYDNDNKCMTGYVLGHELFHFFVFTVGNSSDGHDDPEVWVAGAGRFRYALSAEYDMWGSMAEFCELEIL